MPRNINSKLPVVFLTLLIACLLFTASCLSGDLSRSQAQKLITESNDFKQPAVIEYVQGNILMGRGKGAVESKSDTETETEAVQRRIAEHYAANPQMAVADYFKLIDAKLKRTNSAPEPITVASSYWYFDEHYFITDKGRKMWQDAGLQINETAVPVAFKEFIEVTGLTKKSENTVEAEFTWKWIPNEVGKSLDESTEEFKKLPEKIRQDLIAPNGLKNRSQTLSFSGNRTGKATFKLFDDGWRTDTISFF